jgi:hypothetical protein
MKKVLTLAALLALTACGPKKAQTPPADSTMGAPAPADSGAMKPDSGMARDSAHSM